MLGASGRAFATTWGAFGNFLDEEQGEEGKYQACVAFLWAWPLARLGAGGSLSAGEAWVWAR